VLGGGVQPRAHDLKIDHFMLVSAGHSVFIRLNKHGKQYPLVGGSHGRSKAHA
jgi:hypothetical protein